MARIRRADPAAATADVHGVAVPLCLAVGPLAEAWSVDGTDVLDAQATWIAGRFAWEAVAGFAPRRSSGVLSASAPWTLADPGADARLARHRLTREDVPDLRRAAQQLISTATRGTT